MKFNKRIAILGMGVVGRNLYWEFVNHGIQPIAVDVGEAYEKSKAIYGNDITTYPIDVDMAFVCVPTPKIEKTGEADLTYVHEALSQGGSPLYVIKSAVPPGTCEILEKYYRVQVVCSPEYAGETHHANGYQYPFVILGGYKHVCSKVAEIYKHMYTGEFRICFTDHRTAELTKYMENAFLATKVTFVNEFARIAQAVGVNFDELRELWLMDPRVGRSHTFVYRDAPFYDSKCLNKDIPAIIAAAKEAGHTSAFLESVVEANDRFRADETLT